MEYDRRLRVNEDEVEYFKVNGASIQIYKGVIIFATEFDSDNFVHDLRNDHPNWNVAAKTFLHIYDHLRYCKIYLPNMWSAPEGATNCGKGLENTYLKICQILDKNSEEYKEFLIALKKLIDNQTSRLKEEIDAWESIVKNDLQCMT